MRGLGHTSTRKISKKSRTWHRHGKRRHRWEIQRILANWRKRRRITEKMYTTMSELMERL